MRLDLLVTDDGFVQKCFMLHLDDDVRELWFEHIMDMVPLANLVGKEWKLSDHIYLKAKNKDQEEAFWFVNAFIADQLKLQVKYEVEFKFSKLPA